MSGVVQLARREWPRDREFADPDLVLSDYEVLAGLIRDLHASSQLPPNLASGADAADLGGGEAAPGTMGPAKRRDRLITTPAGRSYGVGPMTIVGFFGERRVDGCPVVADAVENVNADMVDGFEKFPLLLGYVSRMLADDFNYANLVVLKGDDGILKWRDLPEHVTAVMELAPKFYRSVRIYNGALSDGLGSPERLELRVVKYWDYSSPDVWQAERALSPIGG